MMNGQWVAVIILVFLVFIAIAIGIILWTQRKTVLAVETIPNNAGGVNAIVAPVVTGAASRVAASRKPKQQAAGAGATYREVLGKRA